MPVGLLKVNATLGFGRSVIAPAVSEFAQRYPELEIQLLLTSRPLSTLSSNDGATALAWTLDGHGVLMRSERDTAAYVRGGKLEVLLAEYSLPPADIYAVYPQKQHLAAKVRVFVDFLTDRFGQRPGKSGARW